MKKVYRIEGIDCAVCAGKLADAIRKIDGVTVADISFLTEKLTVEAPDDRFNDVMKQVKKLAHKREGAEITEL